MLRCKSNTRAHNDNRKITDTLQTRAIFFFLKSTKRTELSESLQTYKYDATAAEDCV